MVRFRFSRLLCASFVAAALAVPYAASADTYYVSSGIGEGAKQAGDDKNPGTEALPFKTVLKGVSALKSGDTLILRAGDYDTENGLSSYGNSLIPSGKSWETATILKAYQGEKPVLRRYMPKGSKVDEITYRDSWHMATREECAKYGWDNDYPHSCWSGGAGGLQEQSIYGGQGPSGYVVQMSNDYDNLLQYIIIDGLDIDGRGIISTLTFGPGARHIRLQNLDIRYSLRSATSQPGFSDPIETDLQFIHTRIFSAGVPYDKHMINGILARKHPQSRFRHPWYMHSGGNTLIDSETFDSAGTGLGPAGSNNIIVGNYVHDNAVQGLYVAGGDNWYICNNVFYNNGGIEIIVLGGKDHTIANNTLIEGKEDNPARATWGIYLKDGAGACIVENNIIYGFPTGIVNYSVQSKPTILRNNLVYNPTRPGREFVEDKSTTNHCILENNLLGVDPMFVNLQAMDLHLKPGSPAIDKGVANKLKTDKDGISRPQGAGFDIGAFEFLKK